MRDKSMTLAWGLPGLINPYRPPLPASSGPLLRRHCDKSVTYCAIQELASGNSLSNIYKMYKSIGFNIRVAIYWGFR